MKDLKIMADAGHVVWDMERFQLLEKDLKSGNVEIITPRDFPEHKALWMAENVTSTLHNIAELAAGPLRSHGPNPEESNEGATGFLRR